MITIETTRFGEIEYKQEDTFLFEKGIPGFKDEKEFILIYPETESPIGFLQSIRNVDLAFIVTDPFYFFKDYEFDIDEQIKEDLEIYELNDLAVKGILYVPEDFKQTTINLKAPLIINIKKNKGKQLILNDKYNYSAKTPLFINKGGK